MTEKKKQREINDFTGNKIITVFLLSFAGVIGLMVLYRLMTMPSTFMTGFMVLKALGLIGAAGIIIGIVLMRTEKKNKKDVRYKLVNGSAIFQLALTVLGCVCFIYFYNFMVSIKLLYMVLPALAVLNLIYYTYNRQFFWVSVLLSISAIYMWFFGKALSGIYKSYAFEMLIIALAVNLVLFIFALWVQKNNGRFKLFNLETVLCPKKTSYKSIYITTLLMALFFVIGFLTGATYYLVFAILGYFFILAVYNTIKLM